MLLNKPHRMIPLMCKCLYTLTILMMIGEWLDYGESLLDHSSMGQAVIQLQSLKVLKQVDLREVDVTKLILI